MGINHEKFLSWAEARFGGDVVVKGSEIMVNSIFVPDYKHHLSCNPDGGKMQVPHGVYHCWKSNQGGSLVSLVMQVDKCTYDEALETLGLENLTLRELEKKLDEIFSKKKSPETIVVPSGIPLPESTTWIKNLPTTDFWRVETEAYLLSRKLNPEDYLVCTGGTYKNRIIIPYYDRDGKLIYWNGRSLVNSENIPKYRGPDKIEYGIGKGDVLYMAEGWPPIGSKIYLTEGEFDSKSLSNSGFFSGAIGGKFIEVAQIEMLRPYIPVLCMDTDDAIVDAGGNALIAIGEELKRKGFNEVRFVRPPKKFKDWNKMYVETGPKIINAYVKQHEKEFTISTSLELKLKRY